MRVRHSPKMDRGNSDAGQETQSGASSGAAAGCRQNAGRGSGRGRGRPVHDLGPERRWPGPSAKSPATSGSGDWCRRSSRATNGSVRRGRSAPWPQTNAPERANKGRALRAAPSRLVSRGRVTQSVSRRPALRSLCERFCHRGAGDPHRHDQAGRRVAGGAAGTRRRSSRRPGELPRWSSVAVLRPWGATPTTSS